MRLGVRLLLGVFLIVGLAAYFVLSIFSREVKPGVRQGMEVALVDTANLLAELATDDLAQGRLRDGRMAKAFARYRERDLRALIWGRVKRGADLRMYVTDGRGRVLYDSEGQAEGRDFSAWNDVRLTLQGRYGARATRLVPGDSRTSALYVAAPILQDGKVAGVLTVVSPTTAVQPFAERSQRRIRNAGAILVGLSLLAGLALTWWLTRDLARLRAYARGVDTGGRTPLPDLGAPELRELGAALEAMRSRLDGRDYVERYVHTLTHEMKSPLSAIRGAAELLAEPMADADRARFTGNILAQERRMRELVERMLALAELQHRQGLKDPKPVDLAALAARVAGSREPQAARRGVRIRVEGPGAVLQGEAFLLEQALGNLVDNALSFAPSGTEVTVTAQATPPALAVRDHGPGLPAFALDKAFTPFFSLPRPDGEGKGTGLGLCFAREVAGLHGGAAAIGNHPEGGALAELRF